ncbi:MAG: hypothetical protein KF774_00135 [Planctomyces sp.]|nr:hypothetical protein [Planctomyces sp.]
MQQVTISFSILLQVACRRSLGSRIVALCMAAALFGGIELGAAELKFAPGDAYFRSSLSAEDIARIKGLADRGETTLRMAYAVDLRDAAFSGSAGFSQIEIDDASDVMQSLCRAYGEIRATHPRVVAESVDEAGEMSSVERNPLRAFIYNADTDWSTTRIGLRYNEDWVRFREIGAQGPSRGVGAIVSEPQSFVRTYSSIAEEWKKSSRIDGLKVAVPENVAWAVAGETIEVPVRINAKDVSIVVLCRSRGVAYFEKRPGAEWVLINGQTSEWMTWDEEGKVVRLSSFRRNDHD